MNSFKDRLKQIMSERKISQSELSRRTGIGRNSISDYLNGKYEAKQDKVFELAKALNVNEAWLMGFDISKNREIENSITSIYDKLTPPRQKRVLDFANEQLNEQNNKVLHINSHNVISEEVAVYGYASAGTGETLIDGVEFTTQYNGHIPNHDFALQVNGDSMEPLFEDKEIIFVDKTKQINSGQIGIFVIDGEAYLKKVFISDKGIRLVSLNSKYPDLHFDSSYDIKVAGKVIL
ncbi:TPA: helix-turn-helix domain-containing protein [Staphylococcus pseudintermedius]|uniref:LexA family transcriptional regulator n=1 Tax=Staphylococcus pseudintermedius TaxID=283734 RepID=UPI0011228889|nr:LexA family transcriptional regulator [Staphylococcus pseudintermedius]EGQ1594979.1 helix-turn-helix domain-containing protein [Staphylococcus pseudintermedius]EGQ2784735.1 helix-turn-helix domain-containing protein [Staphylococcus pseudintermedius]EGQ3244953.1 helix-turn-helix domain-containing protein [Staphylococcus pseudintermedius]EGQ4025189.1 helix-turn-helix domain-containing protein [Staphylococcus pseudintermedius]EGQ4367312.1 helix-turn-helix domain-containing protein [Staphylococ